MTAKPDVDLLVLAAHTPELVGLEAALGPELSGQIARVRVACATIGVGLPAAAAGTARRLHEFRPRQVLLLGSCGLYPKQADFQPLWPVVPSEVHLVDGHVLAERAAFPAPIQVVRMPDTRLSDSLASSAPSVLRAAVATTLGITTDDALALSLGERSGCAAENLEAYSVAAACGELGVPFVSLLVATNAVGSSGRAQWRTHQRAAAEHGAQLVLSWVAQAASELLPHSTVSVPAG
jgi:nucleoside phosphorylase